MLSREEFQRHRGVEPDDRVSNVLRLRECQEQYAGGCGSVLVRR